MRFDDALKLHLQHLKFLNARPATIDAYARHLKCFGTFLASIGVANVTAVTPKIVERYRSYLLACRYRGKPLAVVTQLNRLCALNRLYETLLEKGVVPVNVPATVPLPRRQHRMPSRLPTVKEVHRLLRLMPIKTANQCRDRCVVELLYATGIRKSELAYLRIADFDIEHSTVRVIGKGLKDRTLPLTPRACHCLRHYVRHIRPLLANGALLFPTCWSGPLNDETFKHMLRQATARAGIRRKVTPHIFRHVLATELLRNGANLRAIQEYLGHHSIETTVQYVSVLGADLKKTHRKTHPREKGYP